MADTINPIDYAAEDLATFLAKAVSDGTYADVVEALKTDAPGNATAATGITTSAGALLGNLMDDAFLAAYPLLRQVALGGAGGWSLGDSTTVNMGANGALYLFDDGLTDSHNSNDLSVVSGSARYIEHMGKTFIAMDGTGLKATHDATLDALGDLTISWVFTLRGKPWSTTQRLFGYGDSALSGADSNHNLNYLAQMFSSLWETIHENGSGTDNKVAMADPNVIEIGMTLGMMHLVRDATAKTYTWYYNAEVAQTAGYANNATTGGTPAQELWIGQSPAAAFKARMWLADLKINPGTALTQAQVDAEYEQVFG